MSNGKGSKRRREDTARVRANWPNLTKKPKRRRLPSLLHPMSGDPCSFEEWKTAEIQRIVDKDD